MGYLSHDVARRYLEGEDRQARRRPQAGFAGRGAGSPCGAGATIFLRMPQRSERDRIIEALQDLPPEATFDDAIERLIFLAKIEAGLTELDAGEGIPHDQAKQRLHL